MARRTVAEKAYLAGFLDGEGTVGCNLSKTSVGWTPYLRVAFANYDHQVLKNIYVLYGGSLAFSESTQVWGLHLNGEQAAVLLRDVLPYLMIKREASSAAIKMYDNLDDRKLRLKYAIEVMEATRRGYKAERSNKNLTRLREELEKCH